MIEREKITKGLEYHLKELTVGKTCFECPYCGDDPCEIHLITDVLTLLKEQEPVKPIRLENWWKCPSCSGNIVANMKYCPRCGRSVKWNE